MNVLGQCCLLLAFVGSGYAAFACLVGARRNAAVIGRSGRGAAIASVVALTATTGVLIHALLVKDFRFAYVAQYSSRLLPWHYSLSALWVGQAGSLLLWAWLTGMLALVYRFGSGVGCTIFRNWPLKILLASHRRLGQFRKTVHPTPTLPQLEDTTFGVLMGCFWFLVSIMVFAADPMEASLGTPQEGTGLSPLLQHPAMLIHPPIVFLGFAGWAVPFALAIAALLSGTPDEAWVREARTWSVFAWGVLGAGILWGGLWAYEELGWGGYWAWDPVENGSLIPWLTGTALIHTLMSWQYRGVFKKTAVLLAIATFGLCNFSSFLTRSGIFSSLHAFSDSPIGWMFLGLMIVLMVGGGILIAWRRTELCADTTLPSVWAREAVVSLAVIALSLLGMVTLVGTLAAPLTKFVLGSPIVVGLAFYNNVLIPTGLLLLATTAAAPLLRWGGDPSARQKRLLLAVAVSGTVPTLAAILLGVRHPVGLAVVALATCAVVALAARWFLDAAGQNSGARIEMGQAPNVLFGASPIFPALKPLASKRREYVGYAIHLGFVCLAIGVTGSSLGTRRQEVTLRAGETMQWAGHTIQFAGRIQRELPHKLIEEARVLVSRDGGEASTLLPAQHRHHLSKEWTSEVAIKSDWSGDFFVALRGGEEDGSVHLTLVMNPLMRFLWLGGWIMGHGAILSLAAARKRWHWLSQWHSADPRTAHTDVIERHDSGSDRSSQAA